MKRVDIKTPGKVITFKRVKYVETPAKVLLDDVDINEFKKYLENMEIDDYTVENVRIPKRGVHEVVTGRGSNVRLKLKW